MAGAPVSPDQLATHFVAACTVIMGLSIVLSAVFQRLRQPKVIGQIFAGIALGPSLLGQLPDHVTRLIVPPEVVPYLAIVAQLALVLFLFAVGYEMDLRILRQHTRAVPVIVGSAFAAPMLLGVLLALGTERWYGFPASGSDNHVGFVMFIAVAMSITALPVLASIISERGMCSTRTGVIAMTSAGAIDALCWFALVGALIATRSTRGHPPLVITLLLFAAYLAVMVFVARPLLARWLCRPGARRSVQIPMLVTFAMGSAFVTTALGLHVIFGAFLAGLVLPRGRDGAPDVELIRPLQETGNLLLPLFFVVAGLPVNFQRLDARDLVLLAAVCAVAIIGKFGGGALSARLVGLRWRDAATIGVMLNTRGLTELVVLSIGLQAGIINGHLYTVLVLMALLTTVLTGPSLDLLRASPLRRSGSTPGKTRVMDDVMIS